MNQTLNPQNQDLMSQNINIDINQTTQIRCKECDSEIFIPAYKFRKASKLLTGNMEDTIIPIQVFICNTCKTEWVYE